MTQTEKNTTEPTQEQTSRADIWEKIQTVNALLQAQEPENISVDTYGGYTGYKPQYIKNAMNEVFGPDGWGYDEISLEEKTAKTRDGEMIVIIARVECWIDGAKRRPRAYGQSIVSKGAFGDAQKGADTDGMKKALSDFSIGARAFEGKLSKEDVEEWKQEQEELARARANVRRETRNRARASSQTQERKETRPVSTQAASAAPVTRQQSAHREPAPLNNLPAPQDGAPVWGDMITRFTTLNPLNSAGKPITWTKFLQVTFKDDLATNSGLMKVFLDSTKQQAIDAGLRLKLHSAIKALEGKR